MNAELRAPFPEHRSYRTAWNEFYQQAQGGNIESLSHLRSIRTGVKALAEAITEGTVAFEKNPPCSDVDPTTFFPGSNQKIIREAKTICETCPVRRRCLTDALEREKDYSAQDWWVSLNQIIGGLTNEERRKLLLYRNRT